MKQAYGIILFLTLILIVQDGIAGGFQTNLQGQKQSGMGGAGTGTILDGGSIFFNPGAIAFLDTVFTFHLASSFQMSRTAYLENSPGIYKTEMSHTVPTPFSGYVTYKKEVHSKFAVGIGVYSPFGNIAQWDDNWKGQFIVRQFSLSTVFFQPTLSYKLTDKLGIGTGFIIGTGVFDMQKALPVQFADGHYSSLTLHSLMYGVGYNTGVYYKVNDQVSLGLNYRSAVNMKVNGGSATFDVPTSVAQSYPNTTFSSGFVMPSVISLGVGYKCGRFLFAVDVNYTGWSCYDSLRITFADHTQNLPDIHSARMYKNSFTYRLGAQYKFNTVIQARLGAYFDTSPVQAGYLTPDMPDANRIGITGGASFRIGKFVSLDACMVYEEGRSRTDTNLETQFSGTFKTRVIIPGIGMEVRF
jgi:long-chain fatty acid transport protein